MRGSFRLIILLAVPCLLFAGCSASYTKKDVAGSVEKLIKKEYGLDGKARLLGETLYLEVMLQGLVSTEQKDLTNILKKVQGASLVITRVSLSSDAKIKYMVLVVSEPTYKLHLRVIQKLDDIKAFLYQKVSKEDYEDRLVLEIENNEPKTDVLESEIDMIKEMDDREFVGRLIISQINMLSRSNPFLAVMLGNTQLRYLDFQEGELTAKISNEVSKPVEPFFEEIVNNQSIKIAKKYDGWGPKRIKLTGSNGRAMIIDIVPKQSVKPRN